MSRRTYPKSKCRICEEYVSTAGAAKVSHKRKHAREGLLVEMWSPILDRNDFFSPEKTQEYMDATTPQGNYAEWRKVAT